MTARASEFDWYLEMEPVEATRLGDHRFDDFWPLLGEEGDRERQRRWSNVVAKMSYAQSSGVLADDERIDAAIVENRLRSLAFDHLELRPHERDPMALTGLVGDGLDPLVNRHFAPLDVRVRSLTARLAALPELLEKARRFTDETPAVATATAIEQNQGLVALCEKEIGFDHVFGLEAPLAGARLWTRRRRTRPTGSAPSGAISEATRSHEEQGPALRLGRELFEKKLRLELDEDVDIDAIAKGARELLERTQEEMVETAARAWGELAPGEAAPPTKTRAERLAFVRRALDLVARDRPTDQTIVAEAGLLLDETTRFVRDQNLVRVPDEPCRVIEMPEYRRGVSIAYCDASGPLEPKPETFYAIAPTPAGWSRERAASFYREYNRSMLVDLTVHEAMPGHFLQLMHAASCPSLVRAIFASGTFCEGWAVYSEWLMAKHGFGGPKVELMRQKMVLRLSVNALLDHGVHAGDMGEAAALDLMMNEAFQEEGEAVGKWQRVARLPLERAAHDLLLRLHRDDEAPRPGREGPRLHRARLARPAALFRLAATEARPRAAFELKDGRPHG